MANCLILMLSMRSFPIQTSVSTCLSVRRLYDQILSPVFHLLKIEVEMMSDTCIHDTCGGVILSVNSVCLPVISVY